MRKILRFLDYTDKVTTWYEKSAIYLIYPVIAFLEYLSFCVVWHKCKKEICTNDAIVNFLSENDFAINNHRLQKFEVIGGKDINYNLPEEQMALTLTTHYTNQIVDIVEKNSILNITDYLSILVNCNIPQHKVKIYRISIEYYRLNVMQHRLFIVGIITAILSILAGFIYNFKFILN